MPPSDQEPRYQLVDSNGNVVGSLFGDGSGNVVIADETDTQTTFGTDGITTPALEAESADVANVAGVLSWDDGGTSQTVASSTITKVDWDSATIDDSVVSADPANDEIIIQDSGTYQISGIITFEGGTFTSGDFLSLFVYINSSPEFSISKVSAGANRQTYAINPVVLDLSQSDTVDLRVSQSSGSDQDLSNALGNSSNRGQFSVVRV